MGITEGFGGKEYPENTVDTKKVEELIDKRKEARKSGDFTLADELREQLLRMGIVVVDEKDGSTHWKKTD